ncbi:MAG TPA: DoxX family protein [Candidatus Paceibacterota bacterium]|nr:DoxX family protein [Candidatus Paceibacterota bacterium]
MDLFLISYYGLGSTVLRLVIGIIFVVHGWPKVKDPKGIAQAAWGGHTWIGLEQGLVETLGGLAMIVGLWVVWVSLVFIVIMLGALFFKIVKWKTPFTGHGVAGWEFDLLILAGLLALLFG